MHDESGRPPKSEYRGASHDGGPVNTPHPPDETERDAWLTEALRHAPDAEAAPPAALSDVILREARAAAAATAIGGDAARSTLHARGRSTAPAPPSMWALAWAWLLRPPVASGFATALIAVLLGVMWQGRSPEETPGRAPAADASPPAPAPAPAPAAAAEASAPIASLPAPAPTPRTETSRRGEAPTGPRNERAADASAARMRSPDHRSAEQERSDAPQPSRAAAAPKASSRDEASPDLASAPSAPPPQALALAPAPPAAAPPREAARAAAANTDTNAADSRFASASESAGAAPRSLAKAAPPRSNDLEALRAAIEADPTRWRWQRGEALQPTPMTPALRGWLAQLAAATATRWRPEPEPVAFDEATVLKLYRDGTLSATLRLTDGGVRLDGGGWAALTADSLAALRQALDAATR
jgi:hypothetical protein